MVLAADGEEALELLATGPIDIALVDVLMPRRTGFSVCRQIKSTAQTRLLPVVLITGLSNTDDRVQGIECGADDFLCKPIKKEELIARVKFLLRIKHVTDELEHAETVLFSLALGIEAKDPYTEGHCHRLGHQALPDREHLRSGNGAQNQCRRHHEQYLQQRYSPGARPRPPKTRLALAFESCLYFRGHRAVHHYV